ncbi:hypothetical protein [Intrasporangium sp. DVR]|uniref:hypothetical protein n=1 Tax=Intrasporangium sp. DVR TaxID=3127867 RepID=UPI00313A6448
MKRLTRFVAILTLVAAGSAGTAAATAAPPAPPPGLPLYLALGDSIANGENSNAPADVDDYWVAVAAWRANGYVTPLTAYLKGAMNCLPAASDKAADGCRNLQLTNLARSAVPADGSQPSKPGVTSTLFIQEQLGRAEAILKARNQDDNPRNDVEVVTLTVGGNEIFDAFMTGDEQVLAAAFGTFIGNYNQILARLRAAAGPDAEILTMTYFNPLPYCGFFTDPNVGHYYGNLVLEQIATPVGNGLNGVIRTISAVYDAVPAEVYGQLGDGDFANCKHPDESGYAKITTAFTTAWVAATQG